MSSQLRVGLAQVNPTVGDLINNRALILENAEKAALAGVHLLVFPEMVLTGYPVEDLALRQTFRKASRRIIAEVADSMGEVAPHLAAIVGYLDEDQNGAPQNAVALIYRGQIRATYIKHHLPNYGVFDEFRNFIPGTQSLVFRLHGIDVGVAICEDIWHTEGPVADLAARRPGLVVVPNGSPYERGKSGARAA